jgi:virginiamycin B lyase
MTLALSAAGLGWTAPSAVAEPTTITEIPTGNQYPLSITSGPDGNLWITESSTHTIGRITPTGSVTHFLVDVPPGMFSVLNSITAGSDGNLWFTDQFIDRIGRITPNGVVTFFAIPPHKVSAGVEHPGLQVGHITSGPDGNLWFTESVGNQIVRLTTSGVFTEFPLPIDPLANPADSPDLAFPVGITAGPDGNLWFTETRFGAPHVGNKIGRITTAGVITEFPIPTPDSVPGGITAGPDGNVWFTEQGADIFDSDLPQVDKIGRITPGGSITEFPAPPGSNPADIATGADGNLWLTERSLSKIARMTTAGAITEFPTPTRPSVPRAITAGPDGRIWFTEVIGVRVGRTEVLGCTSRRTGLINGPLNLTRGATCLSGAQVNGPITVGPGASLFVDNSQLTGGVSANGPGVIRICGSLIRSGGVTVKGATDVVQLGDPNARCAANYITGSVTLTNNSAPTDVVGGTRIDGSLNCSNNATAPTDGGQPAVVAGQRTGQCATSGSGGSTTSTSSPSTSTSSTSTTMVTTTTTTPASVNAACAVIAQQLLTATDPNVRQQLLAAQSSMGCPH